MLGKPQAQSLFRQVMMSEVMSQPENPRHVATADLGSGFTYFSIELGCLLDNQDPGVRPATFEDDSRRGTGKGAADDCHIVIHGEENDAGDRCERQFPSDLTIKSGSTSVILSGVEGSRWDALKVTHNPATVARDDEAKLPLSLRHGIPRLRSE
jgi:hypothetical protein